MSDDAIGRVLDRYYENTLKRVDLCLDDDSFHVPDPQGVDGLEQLPEDEVVDDDLSLEQVKRMLKVKT